MQTMSSDSAAVLFDEISKMSGHAKIHALNISPAASRYVLAAYDPFTKYYLTNCSLGIGNEQFSDETWGILNQLSKRRISGYQAQTVVNNHTKRMTKASADLFRKILRKDLRMGMGIKTINKALPGLVPTHDVMLAKLFEEHRLSYPCWGSIKIDGVRGTFKRGKFFSRNGHEYVGLDHLQEQLSIITEDIDGELVVPGVSFQVGSGWIRSDDPTPDAQFKMIELPTMKVPLIERITMMDDLHFIGPDVHKIKRQLLHNRDEVQEFYKICRRQGYEGAVITPYDYEYVGSRSYRWMKMKPVKDYDAPVHSLYEGKGKYEGQMGGVWVNFKGKPNRVGGGWSDHQRKVYWKQPELIIGKMIEIHYMEETDDGNMRHARFFDFRPDKEV